MKTWIVKALLAISLFPACYAGEWFGVDVSLKFDEIIMVDPENSYQIGENCNYTWAIVNVDKTKSYDLELAHIRINTTSGEAFIESLMRSLRGKEVQKRGGFRLGYIAPGSPMKRGFDLACQKHKTVDYLFRAATTSEVVKKAQSYLKNLKSKNAQLEKLAEEMENLHQQLERNVYFLDYQKYLARLNQLTASGVPEDAIEFKSLEAQVQNLSRRVELEEGEKYLRYGEVCDEYALLFLEIYKSLSQASGTKPNLDSFRDIVKE